MMPPSPGAGKQGYDIRFLAEKRLEVFLIDKSRRYARFNPVFSGHIRYIATFGSGKNEIRPFCVVTAICDAGPQVSGLVYLDIKDAAGVIGTPG